MTAREALATGDAGAAAELLGRAEEAVATAARSPTSSSSRSHASRWSGSRRCGSAAVEERVDAELALGRHVALVPELEALVDEHPYRERFRAQLMLALYRSGRQAEGLDVYRRTRAFFVDELGLEPGVELQELERAILVQDPALERTAAHANRRRSGPFASTARTRGSLPSSPRTPSCSRAANACSRS